MSKSFGNAFMEKIILSPFHGMLGKGLAVITVTGRKTGKVISTPVNAVRLGDGFTILSSRERTWWRNLRGGAIAQLHTEGETFNVQGEVIEGKTEVLAALTAYFKANPKIMNYFKVTANADGTLNETDMARTAVERVVIRLKILPPK